MKGELRGAMNTNVTLPRPYTRFNRKNHCNGNDELNHEMGLVFRSQFFHSFTEDRNNTDESEVNN